MNHIAKRLECAGIFERAERLHHHNAERDISPLQAIDQGLDRTRIATPPEGSDRGKSGGTVDTVEILNRSSDGIVFRLGNSR
jgi:hypothetical protein